MKVGDMVRDLAAVTTSAQRKADMIRQLNELGDREEKYQSWLTFSGSNPSVREITAQAGIFELSPIDGVAFSRQISAQSIPNNTETIVSINGATPATELATALGGTTGIKVKKYSTGKVFGFFGWAYFASNGTGYRQVALRGYDPNNVLLFGQALVTTLPANTGTGDYLAWGGHLYVPDETNLGFIKFLVYQNSGGALNLERFRGCIFALR